MSESIAIIGAGQAGASLALQLRELGYAGGLKIFGAEPHPPYQRPPLSKKYLSGEWDADRLYLRADAAWRSLDIEIRTGCSVSAIDPARKTLTLGDETFRWDKLALTTGAHSRPFPPEFSGFSNVFDLRSLGDVDRLRASFKPGVRMAVIGGGFIGLETAAVAAKLGIEVTVIERAARIMERAVGPATSAHFRALHAENGVRVLESSGVAGVEGNGTVSGLTLLDGTRLPVDLVLIGIGVLPGVALAEGAGLMLDNGIAVDAFGRTSAPGIWAAGDCCSFPYEGQRIRLESVQNAVDQAKAVAADMHGKGTPYHPYPWFWSDQYETKLQIAGLFQGYSDVVTRSAKAGESHWYFKGNTLIAVEAINDPAAFMIAKKLLPAGISPARASLADEAFDPRRCLA